jgi:uncharacterized protein (UPF0261 family)
MQKKTIVLVGTFDTKAQECLYVKNLLVEKNHEVVTIDVGTGARGTLLFPPDYPREEIVKAAGSSMEEVLSLGNTGKEAQIMEIMTRGAIAICQELLQSRMVDGIVSLGGTMGTNMGTTIMRSLPFGLPKVMLSTVASGDTRLYVGTKDIVMVPSIADIIGLNPITKTVLDQTVGAVTGMATTVEAKASWKPLIAISSLGGTQKCASAAKNRLEEEGYEVAIFHSNGIGGRAMEELIERDIIKAVFDLSPNEVVDHMYGGWADAGPARLETAGQQGKPQLVGPANVDHIIYDSRAKIPERFRNHYIHMHGPALFVLRTKTKDMEEIAKYMAEKLNKARGPTAVIHSLKGISALDLLDEGFVDNEANLAYLETLKRNIRPDIEVKEVDAHVNDDVFADEAAKMLLRLMGTGA